MERLNLDLADHEPARQVRAAQRHEIASYVDQVSSAARSFVDQAGVHPARDYLDEWRTGAVIVASAREAGDVAPREFTPSRMFIAFFGLDDISEPKRTHLSRYLLAETDRRTAAAIGHLLHPEDLDLLVRVGHRHGRRTTRALLSEILPFFVELEHGIAAAVATDVQRALKEAS